jgi:hypothetical protein
MVSFPRHTILSDRIFEVNATHTQTAMARDSLHPPMC